MSDLFVAKNPSHDVVRVVCGRNISTGGTQNRPIISVSDKPYFTQIYSGTTDLSDIFVTQEQFKNIVKPDIGPNLVYGADKRNVIQVTNDPSFDSIESNSITSTTASFGSITYKGRPIEDFLPSTAGSNSTPFMFLDVVSWDKNPEATRSSINRNFETISRSFGALVNHKMDGVSLARLNAEEIILSGFHLYDLFVSKNEDHDVVRISCGVNIITAGTQNRPIIDVRSDPKFASITASTAHFKSIYLDGSSIFETFYPRREAEKITHPALGNNLVLIPGEDGNMISVVDSPVFNEMKSVSLTASTSKFESIQFRGSPIENWFGSHTFIYGGKNILTGGTPHAPTVSVVSDPKFDQVTSSDIVTISLTASSICVDNLIARTTKSDVIITDGFHSGDDIHFEDGRITIGSDPENQISSFVRTKVRLSADKNSSIHHALIVHDPEHTDKQRLNDDTVDLVIRGDGRVGIGAFSDLFSLLTVRSKEGYDQLNLSTPFTPKSSTDERGVTGNISWDEEYVYVKTKMGWRRMSSEAF